MALTRLGGNQSINLATNTTGTLGVANGGTGLASGTSGQFLKFTGSTTVASAAVSAGITQAQCFRLHTNTTGTNTPLQNWEAEDTDGGGSIGSDITVSSGVFIFPSTGFWLIHFTAEMYYAGDSRQNFAEIQSRTDGSNFDEAAKSSSHSLVSNTGNSVWNSASCDFIFDVTNTSTHNVRLCTGTTNSSVNIKGDSTSNRTHVWFVRLGDT